MYNFEKDWRLDMDRTKQNLITKQVKKDSIFDRKVFIPASISVLLVLITYVWFISFGSWTHWPSITNDYIQLATAFQHGSLSLEIKPSSAVLALQNPYDPAARRHTPYPIDYSLYKGKYYLYFGPIPALLLVVIKFLGFATTNDNHLVFIFASGTLIFQSLLIVKIWKRFFQSTSIWVLPLCILFSGLAFPIPWILTEARIYEAASTGGQFFFLAGFYFVFTALDRETISIRQFILAGTLWTFAIGSRLTQIVPISFALVMVIFWIFRTSTQSKLRSRVIYPLIALCSPIILGAAILGWYNWARFDSIFETGFYYALAGPYLQKYSHVLFSPLYLLPNLYNYLVMRPKISMTFPFLQSMPGYGTVKFPFIQVPPVYHEWILTGILFSTPFILFAAIPILFLLLRKRGIKDEIESYGEGYPFKWLVISLLGSFLFGFAPIAAYFYVVARFLADFTPSLILLSIIGFWQGYSGTAQRPTIHKIYITVGIILIAASIVIGILLALSAHAEEFQTFNPALWGRLVSLFPQ